MIESEAAQELVAPETRARAVPLVPGRRVGLSAGILLFTVLTAVGAYVAVPLGITPVPMTLQTLFVLLSGAVLGAAGGAASQLLYLALGVAGLPVFAAGGAGLPWVFGPTGGFLMAFPMAAAVAGWMAGREKTLSRTAAGLVAGTVLLFAFGSAWLAVITDSTAGEILGLAVLPFLVGAALKVAIALLVSRQIAARGL